MNSIDKRTFELIMIPYLMVTRGVTDEVARRVTREIYYRASFQPMTAITEELIDEELEAI